MDAARVNAGAGACVEPAMARHTTRIAGDDPIHAALKAAVEVPTEGYLWAQRHEFTPAVCSRIFGDGRALLALTTINSRPRYYVIRIDSSWEIDESTAPKGAVSIRDHLDAIYDALEDDFGRAYNPDEESDEVEPWPTFDDRHGTNVLKASTGRTRGRKP